MKYKNSKFEEDDFSKNAQGFSKICYEVLVFMKFLQTRPQHKHFNIIYYDLYYTVIKNRDEKEIVNNKNEKNENDYNILNDFITPYHYIWIKNDKVMLR